MAKSAPISCETAQKSRGRDRGQGHGNRQRRCERKPQHREKRTSVPCSPVLGAENELAAPPPGAAARDPHPARNLARPAGKRSGSSSRKQAIHLHRLDSATLLSAYRSLTVISAARQRSMRPARMSRLAASPLADNANPPMAGKRSRQPWTMQRHVLRRAVFDAHPKTPQRLIWLIIAWQFPAASTQLTLTSKTGFRLGNEMSVSSKLFW